MIFNGNTIFKESEKKRIMYKKPPNQLSFFENSDQKSKTNHNKLNLFISYSRKDENLIKGFEKHTSSLVNNIDFWRDRKIQGGEKIKDKISEKLNTADIICVFLSSDYLKSESCKIELQQMQKLKVHKQWIHLIPIILSPCEWKNKTKLKDYLALPQDAKPINSFSDSEKEEIWTQIAQKIKEITNKELLMRKIEIKQSTKDFLNNTEILSKTHSQKTKLLLEDIFIYPDLTKCSDQKIEEQKIEDQNINSKDLFDELMSNKSILISGQSVSGKTALCKKIFSKMRESNLVPIFLSDDTDYQGFFKRVVEREYTKQYEENIVSYQDIDNNKIIPIIDNFHLLTKKSKVIQELLNFKYHILTSDDIFLLNVRNERYVKNYSKYKIKEFNNSLRDKLIRRWLSVGQNNSNENDIFKAIDEKTKQINDSLGKNIIFSGIMPSYPLFILSMLSSYETLHKPISNQITSQGYCYEILIYASLLKQNVTPDDIDTYMNFLTMLSYDFFSKENRQISNHELHNFLNEYKTKYYLTIDDDTLLTVLYDTKIFLKNNFGDYYFNYPYIYYFFVARYMSSRLKEDKIKTEIKNIIENLHNDNNAYIAIFLVHHSDDPYILDQILNTSRLLFAEYSPATLLKKEMKFFDDQCKTIVKASLPNTANDPDRAREKRLKIKDEIEESNNEVYDKQETKLSKQLRRSVRTVETMGQIVRNRAGSLEIKRIEEVLLEAINVHLRVLSSFFKLIEHPDTQKEFISYLKEKIKVILAKKDKNFNEKKLNKIAERLFWNLNFQTVNCFIYIIVHSLGSDKLNKIIETICNKKKTPISQIIKYGVDMWYCKHLPVRKISVLMNRKDFSEIAKEVTKYFVINHILLHNFNYKDLQKIKEVFNFPEHMMKNITIHKRSRLPSPSEPLLSDKS